MAEEAQALKKEPVCINPATSPDSLCIPKDFIWKLAPHWPRITQEVDLGDNKMVGLGKKKNKQKNKKPTHSILESRNFRNVWLYKIKPLY